MNKKIEKLLQNQGGNYIFPFFWQHGEKESVLREYMKVIDECHIGAVCIESRPHPDYVGPGWWHDMDIILEEARNRGMKVWILDDSHFPTGYANGALEEADPKLCKQSLTYQTVDCPTSGESMRLSLEPYRSATPWKPSMAEEYQLQGKTLRQFEDDELISITAVKRGGNSLEDIIDLMPMITDDILNFIVPDGEWKIYICHLTRNRGFHRNYINMLDEESCKILIDTVYEPHYKRYAKDFGNTIAGFFSDEPELGNGHLYEEGLRIYELEDQPWSSKVQVALVERWDENLPRLLPLLWEQDFDSSIRAKVRYDFMDVVTRLVETCFSMQLGNWCRNHGVEYIGHLIEDNNQHTRSGSSLGHYFRGLAGQDMAGIDDIGGQVLPQGEWVAPDVFGKIRDGEFFHYILGKLASSAAAIDPIKKGRSMCEIFGNYGWSEGVRLEKYLVDHFLVRGVNHYVPHAFSPKEFPDMDCPPHFYAHGNNPQYRHFGKLMQYLNRMCELLNDGKHIVPVAILYNAETDWTGEGMYPQNVARPLAENQIDYDILPADVFAEPNRFRTKLGSKLIVNDNEYKVFLIPETQFITLDVANAVRELTENGFRVIFINRLPEGICDMDDYNSDDYNFESLRQLFYACQVVPLEALVECLYKYKIHEIQIIPKDSNIRYYHYSHEHHIYMLVNEGTETYYGTVQLPETGPCYYYNAWENCLEEAKVQTSEKQTVLSVVIEPLKSILVVFDDSDKPLKKAVKPSGVAHLWNQGWIRSLCNAKEYPCFTGKKEISLPDKLAEEAPEFSGFVCYEKIYHCDDLDEKLILEITDAYEGVELFVNNRSLDIQIVPHYYYDLTGCLCSGDNHIRIEVATTLERATQNLPDFLSMMGKKNKPECPSGINGNIILWKC